MVWVHPKRWILGIFWREIFWREIFWHEIFWREIFWREIFWREIFWRKTFWRELLNQSSWSHLLEIFSKKLYITFIFFGEKLWNFLAICHFRQKRYQHWPKNNFHWTKSKNFSNVTQSLLCDKLERLLLLSLLCGTILGKDWTYPMGIIPYLEFGNYKHSRLFFKVVNLSQTIDQNNFSSVIQSVFIYKLNGLFTREILNCVFAFNCCSLQTTFRFVSLVWF